MLTHYYQQGILARLWYDETWEFLQEEFGPEARRLAAYIAITSPNATVQANVTLALKALKQHKENKPFDGFLGSVKLALSQFDMSNDTVMGGPKIRCFFENLTGNLVPVTVDRWIARALGSDKNPRTIQDYMKMSLEIAEFARSVDEEPARAQAAIWQGIRHAEQTKFDFGDMKELLWAKTRQMSVWDVM